MALDLLGAHEIHPLLGDISRQRLHQITRKPGFPKPVTELTAGKVWSGAAVRAWIAEHRPALAD